MLLFRAFYLGLFRFRFRTLWSSRFPNRENNTRLFWKNSKFAFFIAKLLVLIANQNRIEKRFEKRFEIVRLTCGEQWLCRSRIQMIQRVQNGSDGVHWTLFRRIRSEERKFQQLTVKVFTWKFRLKISPHFKVLIQKVHRYRWTIQLVRERERRSRYRKRFL